MIGATDGHAKNFSLFIRPNNQIALTPIYDVISAQPMFDARQIPHKDFRLAMSLGQKPRYKIQDIQRRHFHQTAEKAGLENDQTSHDSGFTVPVRQYFPVKTSESLNFTAIVYLSVPTYITLGLHFVLQNELRWRTNWDSNLNVL